MAAFAQGAGLTGQAISCGQPANEHVIHLINVEDRQKTITAETDQNGAYRFNNIPAGRYFVQVGHKQYGPRYYLFEKEPLVLIEGVSKEQVITIPRDCSLHEFPAPLIREYVRVAADDEQILEQVSKTVNVIDGQEMRDRADITLVDSLRTIPGFRVQQVGGFGRVATIKSRGLRNHDTAVLIDGVRLRDATAITGDASPFISDITLTSVSRVEVLRGPGSSLYGTNAIGGTIDFQTPVPQSGWHGQVSGAGGGLGFGRFRGNVSYGTSDSKFGFNTGVSRTVFGKGIDGNDDARNTNWQGRVDIRPATSTSISGRFFFSDAFIQLNSDPDTLGILPPTNATIIDAREGVNFVPDVDDPDKAQDSDFFNGQVVFNHAFNSNFDLQAFYSGLKTNRTNINGPLGVGFQSEGTTIFDGQIHTVNARGRWTVNPINTLTFGYELEKEKFFNEGVTPGGFGDFFTRAGQSSHAIYAQDLVRMHDGRFQLAGGFRAQFFSLDQPGFSEANPPYSDLVLSGPPSAITFDGSASYYFRSSGTKIRMHIGTGYRVPSLFERFGSFFNSFGPPPFIAIGDPFLEPEETWAFDAGVDQALAGEKVRLSAVYFCTKLRNTVFFSNFAPDIGGTSRPFGGYVNLEGGSAQGAEFSGRFEPTSTTDIFTSYTFTRSEQFEPQVPGSGVFNTLGIPDHQFTLVATQRFGQFWVNFDLLVTSSYLAPIFSNTTFNSYVYRFDGNARGDLTAGYTLPMKKNRFNLRIFGTIENLFDYEYFENGFRTVGRNTRIGANFSF
jgi:outer membrane receptor protein involved in Fe transport